MLRRLAVLAGAVAATLALASSAQAAPTTPVITAPMASFVCGSSVAVKWTPSTPDAGAFIVQYRADLFDLTDGSWAYKYTAGLGTTFGGLQHGHKYVVRVRALELKNGQLVYSASSARSFFAACLFIPVEKLKQYVEYNPDWGCPMCGLKQIEIEDPGIYRAVQAARPPVAEQIRGFEIEGDGSVLIR